MAKIQTRMEKYKDYRDEIKKEIIQENETKEDITSQVFQMKMEPEKEVEEEVVTKHALEEEKKEKVKAPKSIYDEYLRKRRIRYFLYSLFVLTIIGTAIAILVIYTGKFLG